MNHTYTSQVKANLESVGVVFKKVDTLRWVSYDGDSEESNEIVFAMTLGQCVKDTAKEFGE